jgi:MoaA/NifB/PqqE/SkfB family radical SAM enzyme
LTRFSATATSLCVSATHEGVELGASPRAASSVPAPRSLPLVSEPASASFPVPWYLYLRLATSNVCNFRCKHCHIWMNQDARNRLTTARRVELIHEFSRLRPGGVVEFPGGEVTLAFDELCTLANVCRQTGLAASVVTNGSMLQSAAAAQRLVRSGLRSVTVSLDSHRAEVHDYVRGVPGAFAQATRALELLLAARRRDGARQQGPLIQTIAVVFDGNVHELADYVEFCRSIGVDQACLQVLNRTFDNHAAPRDVFFERHFWHDSSAKLAAASALRDVVERYASDPILKPNRDDLPRLAGVVLKPDPASSPVQCAAHWRNVIVDSDGEVSFCFDQPEGAAERSVGNVIDRSLTDVLASPTAAVMRQHMSTCHKPCAELECHRAPTPAGGAPEPRAGQLVIDWAHRDAFPVWIYERGSSGRVLVMGGLGDNVRLLHLVRPTDCVICFTIGDYQEPAYEMMRRVLHVFGLEPECLSVLCNYPAQVEMARRAGLTAYLCNANAFIDENVFRPQLLQKRFDAVSNARLVRTKRVALARLVPNLALIQGHRLEAAEYDDPAEIPHVYLSKGPLSAQGVARVLSASRVGLALSEAEGACLASSEYLLCGLPVVSTPSRGGRDVWYDADNSAICEPTPEAVRDAVRRSIARLNRGEIDPQAIRGRHIARAEEHRRRFVEVTARAFASVRASSDPARVFAQTFASSGILPRYLPYPDLCRALSEHRD